MQYLAMTPKVCGIPQQILSNVKNQSSYWACYALICRICCLLYWNFIICKV